MAGTYLDVEDQKKSEREREVNVDLKVKLGHKSHARVLVWSCSRANGTRSSSAKNGDDKSHNRGGLMRRRSRCLYIKINNDFRLRVIINPCLRIQQKSLTFYVEGYDRRRRPPCNFLNPAS